VPQKPPVLRPGDAVRVVAPSGSFEPSVFEAGLKLLSTRYKPHYDETLFARKRYLAGDDPNRLVQLERAFTDPEARAVFCARGGYGAARLLPHLNVRAWPARALVGFSDITGLHAAMQCADRISIHAPVVTQLPRLSAGDVERLFQVLEDPAPPAALTGAKHLVRGTVEGPATHSLGRSPPCARLSCKSLRGRTWPPLPAPC